MKLTRRETVTLLGVPVVAAPAQVRDQAAETPEQLLAAARQRLKRNLETLGKFPTPHDAEPAFQFKAQ